MIFLIILIQNLNQVSDTISIGFHSVHGHISQEPDSSMVVFGVVSGDYRCPEPKSTIARDPGCSRKKITFFSKSGTSKNKQ